MAQKNPLLEVVDAKRISSHEMMIDAALAREWLERCAYNRQRPLRAAKVKEYAASIRGGSMRWIEIHLAILGDEEFLVDGQHRLAAVAAAGLPVEVLVVRHRCSDERDVAALYSTYDRGLRRDFVDSFIAYGLLERIGISRRDAKFLTGAMPMLMTSFEPLSGAFQDGALYSAPARSLVAEEWALEATEYFETIAGASNPTGRLLRRGQVIAVALTTFRYQEPRARAFWGRVADEDGLARTDAAWKLLDWLRANQPQRHKPHAYARYVAAAWNADWEGRSPAKLIVKDPLVPIKILGTPFLARRSGGTTSR